ncbi:glycosyltransferase [Salinibacter sp.]|uniref:glycosyltransferase n=1 Tax=Salinibacter sp. TaxID=2065818 RepID=UPI0021E8DF91|nr:glycosyltransferase [Salinibacter sp.]
MRVLQVNKFYEPHVGGVETVVKQLAEGLPEQGMETRVLTCQHKVQLFTTEEFIEGVKVRRAGSLGTLFNVNFSPTFPLLYRDEIEWADVVHFHSPSPTPEFVHLIMGVPADTGVVVTFHADPGTSRWKGLNTIYAPVLRHLLERADRIAVTAPANRDRSELLDGFKQKTDIIPLATEFEVDPPSGEERRRHQRKIVGTETETVILFVGRLSYYKGLHYLLRALTEVDARLVVVGDGELRGDLEEKAEELGITKKTQFEGYVEDEDLSNYYRAADVFVLPSIASIEAFGIVQLDAMAHGVPVVNTSLPTGVPFVSQHEQTGLTVNPKDASALASALQQLVEKPDYRLKLGREAGRRAEKFTEEKMINRYKKLYK